MSDALVIPERFCGPPGAGNGGWVAGSVANVLGGEVEVTIRRPLPLARPLRLRREGERLEVVDGEAILASAVPTTVDVAPPIPLRLAEAHDAAARFPRFVEHPVPHCFVCGPERGDGLRIFPGPVPGRDGLWAAPWTPGVDLGDSHGAVRPEIAWAALDCPGAFAVNEPPRGLALLGRIAARVVRPLRTGEPCIVVAWEIGRDGRKLQAGTAIQSATGELHAIARATWILTS